MRTIEEIQAEVRALAEKSSDNRRKWEGYVSMYRLMQPSDEAAVVALWQKERGDSAEFIKTALEKIRRGGKYLRR